MMEFKNQEITIESDEQLVEFIKQYGFEGNGTKTNPFIIKNIISRCGTICNSHIALCNITYHVIITNCIFYTYTSTLEELRQSGKTIVYSLNAQPCIIDLVSSENIALIGNIFQSSQQTRIWSDISLCHVNNIIIFGNHFMTYSDSHIQLEEDNKYISIIGNVFYPPETDVGGVSCQKPFSLKYSVLCHNILYATKMRENLPKPNKRTFHKVYMDKNYFVKSHNYL